MAEQSSIEWTDATWNPVTGCQVVSPGCTHCYAMRLAGMRLKHHPSRAGLITMSKAGPVWNGQVRFNEQWLDQPLRWKRPRRIFVCAHGDLFADGVEDAWIDQVFAVMGLAPQHTFQVLTKRPARMRAYCQTLGRHHSTDRVSLAAKALRPDGEGFWWTLRDGGAHLPNVWLGVSVEDQVRADERIPNLLATPAAVRFLSVEPLLGPVDLTRISMPEIRYETGHHYQDVLRAGSWSAEPFRRPAQPHEEQRFFTNHSDTNRIDWVIVGGESGEGARPMHPAWVRKIRDDCTAAGVPFFFKQWGSWKEAFHDQDGPHVEEVDVGGETASAMAAAARNPAWLREDGRLFRRLNDIEGAARMVERIGKHAAGRLLDGIEHNAMPGVADV